MSVRYDVSTSFRVEGTDDLATWLDEVVDHLALLNARDVLIVAEGDDTFLASLMIEAEDDHELSDVLAEALSLLRTSFLACNGGTPGWPTSHEDALSRGVKVSLINSTQQILAHA